MPSPRGRRDASARRGCGRRPRRPRRTKRARSAVRSQSNPRRGGRGGGDGVPVHGKPRFVVSVLVPLRPFAPTPSSPPPPTPRRRRRNSDPPRRRCTTPVIKRRWTPPWALWTRTTPPPPWRRRRARRARSDPARSTTDTSEASTRFPLAFGGAPIGASPRRETRPRGRVGSMLGGARAARRRRRVPRSIKSRATIRTDTR